MERENEDSVLYQQLDIFSHGFPVMEDIRRQGKLCDVTLMVETQSFRAHRIVLAATIPYFHAMFTHDMVESKQKDITIHGIGPRALESLINFAYSGRVVIDNNNVQTLMVGASFLQLTKVRDACAEFLKKRFYPHNILGIRSFADTLGCVSLVDATDKYIQQYFHEVSMSEEYLTLSRAELLDIVKRDELHVISEEQVFEAIMRWIKKDPDSRKKNLPQLLAKVRMPLLTPHYIADHVAVEDLIRSSHECRDLLDEARDYHLMPERRPLLQSFRARPRCCNYVIGHVFAVGGLTKSDDSRRASTATDATQSDNREEDNNVFRRRTRKRARQEKEEDDRKRLLGDSLSTVEVHDPILGRWQLAEPMTMLRSRVGVAVLRNKLYAFGGYNGSERLSAVEVFDPRKRTWSRVSPMHYKRSAVGATALGESLYVCGGYDGVTSLNAVERYTPAKDEWAIVAGMMRHRSAGGVSALEGCLYALGGHDGLSIFDSVEKFDPEIGHWVSSVPMMTRRCRLGVTTLGGKLYVCGGYDGSKFLQTVEMFDPTLNKWRYVAPMNVMRSRVALVANMGKLWAIGGYDGVSNLSSVEVYDPNTDSWSFVASMCAHEGGVGVGVVPIC